MTRNLKALGLALVAALAMSAVAASAASAEGQLTTDTAGTSVTMTANQTTTHVFKANGNEVTCKKAHFAATATGGAQEVTVTPAYDECHIIFLFTFTAHVTENGCKYTFTTPTTTGVPAQPWHANTDVVGCTSPLQIEVTINGVDDCEIKIPNQSGAGGAGLTTVGYSNGTGKSGKMDVTVHANVHSIAFTSSGGLCGASGNNGTYTGTATAEAKRHDGTAEGITISH